MKQTLLLSINEFENWWRNETTTIYSPFDQALIEFVAADPIQKSNGEAVQTFHVCINGESSRWIIKAALDDCNFGHAKNRGLYKALAAKGLAPRIIASSSSLNCFEFINGRIIEDANLPFETICDQISTCIRNRAVFSATCDEGELHRSKIALPAHLTNLLASTQYLVQPDSQQVNKLVTAIESLSNSTNFFVCHGDMNFGNLVMTDAGLSAIDWDYFGTAPIEYELAMTMSINQFDAIQREVFHKRCQAAFGQRFPINTKLLNLYLQLCHAINFLWLLSNDSNEGTRESNQLSFYLSADCGTPINNLIKVNEIKGL